MSTMHAFFSHAAALINGSSVFRKESGATVNVTRVSSDKEVDGAFRYTEKYLGRVVGEADGGCVRAVEKADGITTSIMGASDRMRAQDEVTRLAAQELQSWENEGGRTAAKSAL
jgi:hypothetical protein